jgi:hypothetical protein
MKYLTILRVLSVLFGPNFNMNTYLLEIFVILTFLFFIKSVKKSGARHFFLEF